VWPPNQNGRYPVSVGPDRYPFVVPEWRVRRLVLGLDRYLEPFADDDQADDEQADGV
jgi:hypothetical protein